MRGLTEKICDTQSAAFVEFCMNVLQIEQRLKVKDIARRAKLCKSTIYRLRKGRLSSRVQMRTVMRLGHVAGCKLKLTHE